MKRNKFLLIIAIALPVLVFSLFNIALAANPGHIASSTDCSENLSCAKVDNDNSNINFGCTNCSVEISNSAITGYAFGENIGWINLAPTNGGVTNTNQGVLGGYAWGQNAGWVNFAPTNGGVTINKTTGEFDGWAWSQNYGWIEFSCPGSACVTTDWKPGGGTPPAGFLPACLDGQDNDGDSLVDCDDPGCHESYDLTKVCNQNIDDETNPDVCSNIDGAQITMPEGYEADEANPGECVATQLIITIENPIDGQSFWSADLTQQEIVDMGLNTSLPFASFTAPNDMIRAKITGPVGSVNFYLDDTQKIGDTLTSPTTGIDVYEVPVALFTECSSDPSNSPIKNYKITVEAISDSLAVPDAEKFVVITVGRTCGTTATECSDGVDNDSDGGTDYGTLDATQGIFPDPDCTSYDDDSEEGGFCQLLANQNLPECICPTDPDPANNPLCFGPTYCDLHPEDIVQCFCTFPENQNDPKCLPPVLTCFDDPSLCTCADDPTLPGCEIIVDPCLADPNAPGCKPIIPIISVITPEIIEEINLGLKIAATTAVAVGAVISLATALFLNPLAAPELVLIPVRLWSLILTALGIKKRRKPWGTVYDSITKQPLDPVYVSLRDLEGMEVASSITDIDGRYGFLVKPGVYKVIPRKSNYIFPSDNLYKHFRDEFYANLYFGDYINISDSGEVIVKNIPMDPINFDWNEFEKNKKKLYKFYSKREILIAKISNWLFGFGFIIASTALIISPEKYNIIIFGLYILMFALRRIGFRMKAKGRLLDKDGSPLSFAFIRAFAVETNVEIAHSVSDEMGRYHMLIPNGTYYVKIEKKNNDGSYSLIYTSNYFKVVHGVLNRVFNV
ncbi:hypothetical protein KKA39_02290 [Patescibacteria group bacterium]|nr:hypothetical protein [Patescibacteria group bacterium]MBU1728110.1 hypothetical protein [Patescibacteria group bacterium]